jgi:hypothetical protein
MPIWENLSRCHRFAQQALDREPYREPGLPTALLFMVYVAFLNRDTTAVRAHGQGLTLYWDHGARKLGWGDDEIASMPLGELVSSLYEGVPASKSWESDLEGWWVRTRFRSPWVSRDLIEAFYVSCFLHLVAAYARVSIPCIEQTA